jgi:hypothetical protein
MRGMGGEKVVVVVVVVVGCICIIEQQACVDTNRDDIGKWAWRGGGFAFEHYSCF